jgi:hypothetical protein
MAQSILELIFKTSHQGQGGKQAAQELKDLKGNVGELTSGLLGMNLGTLTGVGAVVALGGAVKSAADFTVAAVQDYQKYGEEIRTLSAITGTGAEQTSRLVQAFDDLGVTQEQFATLAQGAAKKGFVMTIDNVAALADKYNSLSTTQEKNKLLTDTLGRSALETAKAFEAGGQAIRDHAAAQEAGLVITDRQMMELELLRRQQDELNDSQTAAKNLLAQQVVPAELDFTNALEKVATGQYSVQQLLTGGIVLLASHEKTIRENTEAALEAGAAAGSWANDVGTKLVPALNDEVGATNAVKGAQDELNNSMAAYSKQLAFKIASQGLDLDQQTQLASAMGLIDEKSKFAIVKTQEWKQELDNGQLTLQQYVAKVSALANAEAAITSKDVTITVNTVYNGRLPTGFGQGVHDDTNNSGHGQANASGFTVPAGYPNDSYWVPFTSGERVTVENDRTRATASSSRNGGGDGVSVNIGTVVINHEADYQAFKTRLLNDIRGARR